MKSLKRKQHILVVAYAFPPCQESGSIRNAKLLTNLLNNSCEITILTVKERYFSFNVESTMKKLIPEDIHIIRTNYFSLHDFIVNLKNIFTTLYNLNTKGKQIELSKVRNSNEFLNIPNSKFTKVKDIITDLVTIPDNEVGWLPFGLFAGITELFRKEVDVIYAIGKPWSGFFIGYGLKLIFKKPLVIDFMDPWTQNPYKQSKCKMLEKLQTFLEKFIVKRADFLIANTQELADDFVKRLKTSPEKVGVITCGYDENDFNYDNIKERKNKQFVISHIGSLYSGRNPFNFLMAIKHLIDNKFISQDVIRINLIGNLTIQEPELLMLIQELSLSGVLFTQSWVPHSDAIKYLYQSDVLLLIQPGTHLQIPAKLYEYIFVKKPIIPIADKNSAIDNIFRREGWGISINNNIKDITDAVFKVYCQFQSGKLNNYIHKENIQPYNVKHLAKKLCHIFELVINNQAKKNKI
ncbi:MAG: glycosyltransferase [Candidatus Scalindua sp.]|nr:glycosyltransferase [Candidatus Scalindua sp.]